MRERLARASKGRYMSVSIRAAGLACQIMGGGPPRPEKLGMILGRGFRCGLGVTLPSAQAEGCGL